MFLRGTNVDPESVISVGDYEFELAAASEGTVQTITRLLTLDPRVEIGPRTQWASYSLLALSGPDTIALRKKRSMGAAVGLIDPDAPGIAVIEMAGADVAGPLTLITTFGVPALADRLRERLAELSREGSDTISIVAAPSAGASPTGHTVVRRHHYTFAYARKAAA
jgi:hypothetical protein